MIKVEVSNSFLNSKEKTDGEINTTTNKARIMSKVINDKYRNDQTIEEYIFNIV